MGRSKGVGTAVAAVLAAPCAVFGTLALALAGPGGGPSAPCASGPGPAGIPPAYLTLYRRAAARYRVPWTVLAAVGAIESDHGRSTAPGVRSGQNYAGAGGPMQFLAATWAAFAVDGDTDGDTDRYDPADAIPTAARYLAHNGADRGSARLRGALFAYNHSADYVAQVLARARAYAAAPVPADGGCAAPVAPPAAGPARAAVTAALRQLGVPYSWGGGGLDGPTYGIAHGAGIRGFDCSALVRYAWHQAGYELPRIAADQWRALPHVRAADVRPGDLVFFTAGGSAGAPGHVGMVHTPGQTMIEAPRTGYRVRVSSLRRRDLLGYARPGASQGDDHA